MYICAQMLILYGPGEYLLRNHIQTETKGNSFFILRPEMIVTEMEVECDSPSSIRG
jgi:hypothetical protein